MKISTFKIFLGFWFEFELLPNSKTSQAFLLPLSILPSFLHQKFQTPKPASSLLTLPRVAARAFFPTSLSRLAPRQSCTGTANSPSHLAAPSMWVLALSRQAPAPCRSHSAPVTFGRRTAIADHDQASSRPCSSEESTATAITAVPCPCRHPAHARRQTLPVAQLITHASCAPHSAPAPTASADYKSHPACSFILIPSTSDIPLLPSSPEPVNYCDFPRCLPSYSLS